MELLVIVLVIVYSVWSEVNKKKQEENVDVDFSELSSLDDFFKETNTQTEKTSTASSSRHNKQLKEQRSKKLTTQKPVNYDELPALTGQVNYTRAEEGNTKKKKNYDDLTQLTGQVNYDQQVSGTNESSYDIEDEAKKLFANEQKAEASVQVQAKPIQLAFDRESFIKAFVMSEVLQRYDLERIYSRIPNINQPED